jgi:hypothetical protein
MVTCERIVSGKSVGAGISTTCFVCSASCIIVILTKCTLFIYCISHLHVSTRPGHPQGAFVTEYLYPEMCLSNIQTLIGVVFMLKVLKFFLHLLKICYVLCTGVCLCVCVCVCVCTRARVCVGRCTGKDRHTHTHQCTGHNRFLTNVRKISTLLT